MQSTGFDFPTFLRGFWHHFGDAIVANAGAGLAISSVHRAEPANIVKQRFMSAIAAYSLELTTGPGFHGTACGNFASIMQQGFLIPGKNNDLEVINGNAYGAGIYLAKMDAAWLSLESRFCRDFIGDDVKLIVCAVLHTEEGLRDVRDSMLVTDECHVVPVFVLSGQRHPPSSRSGRLPQVEPISVRELLHIAASIEDLPDDVALSGEVDRMLFFKC